MPVFGYLNINHAISTKVSPWLADHGGHQPFLEAEAVQQFIGKVIRKATQNVKAFAAPADKMHNVVHLS